MFNLANKITLIRILSVPVIVFLLHFPNRISCLFAALLFLIAAVTDLVDGEIARRRNMVTSFGKFLDPLADKVLIGSVLIMLVQRGWAPGWVAVVIIARELMVTGLRAAAMEKGQVIAADRFGKLKTVLQSMAVAPLTLHEPWFGIDPVPAGEIMLYIALGMTVLSGANYLYGFYRNWLPEDR
ncbi:MAG: CDP-diacylglycerol--glycerol-3-phosphate 3-phosphatidyltransferase [Desulfovibrionaceae bacterium]